MRHSQNRRLTTDQIVTRVLGVVGELLITLGVIVLFFLAWQLWINNAIVAREQTTMTKELQAEWQAEQPSPPVNAGADSQDYGPAPAFGGVGEGSKFATVYIPRLGDNSGRVAVNSVDLPSALNHGYYGHYPQTQWPGQAGNFALAIHRTNWGSPFADSNKLESGDKIYVETKDGYYTYVFRNYEYVLPTTVSVILPTPGKNAVTKDQSLITITTCNPLLGDAERLIVYGVLDSWRPRSAGPPSAIALEASGKAS